jgi:hypothetical protein
VRGGAGPNQQAPLGCAHCKPRGPIACGWSFEGGKSAPVRSIGTQSALVGAPPACHRSLWVAQHSALGLLACVDPAAPFVSLPLHPGAAHKISCVSPSGIFDTLASNSTPTCAFTDSKRARKSHGREDCMVGYTES